MGTYTLIDQANASIYASNRSNIARYNILLKKYPHIATFLDAKVYAATDDDYYIPTSFKKRAIKTEIKITEKACKKLSCNPWHKNGPCKPSDEARYIRIGDQEKFYAACEPSCFHLEKTVNYNKDGEAITQAPALSWNKYLNFCQFDSSTRIWMTLPISRSDKRYEERMNNFELGFNEVDNKSFINGRSYEYNEYYCSQFGEKLKNKNCTEPLFMFFLDAIVGKQLILTVKAAIDKATTGSSLKKSNLPDKTIDDEYLYKNWKNDINLNYTKLDVDMDAPSNIMLSSENHTPAKNFINEIYNRLGLIRKETSIENNINRRMIEDEIHLYENKLKNINDTKDDIKKTIDDILNGIKDIPEYLLKFIESIPDMLIDPKTYAGMLDSIILDTLKMVTKQLGKVLVKISEKSAIKLSEKVFASTISIVFKKAFSTILLKVAGKVLLALSKLIAEISSVVGIILILASILDIAFSFWDPFGFNNQFPNGYLDSLQTSIDYSLLQSLQSSSPELTFDIMCAILLTKDEQLLVSLTEFEYVYEYLNSLTVNSEGTRIDKGKPFSLNDKETQEQKNKDEKKFNAQTNIYSQKELYNYEYNFKLRILNIKLYNFLNLGILCIGLIFCLFKFFEIGLIIILISMILFILITIGLINDYIFDYDLATYITNSNIPNIIKNILI